MAAVAVLRRSQTGKLRRTGQGQGSCPQGSTSCSSSPAAPRSSPAASRPVTTPATSPPTLTSPPPSQSDSPMDSSIWQPSELDETGVGQYITVPLSPGVLREGRQDSSPSLPLFPLHDVSRETEVSPSPSPSLSSPREETGPLAHDVSQDISPSSQLPSMECSSEDDSDDWET